MKGKRINVVPAPEPGDVQWINLQVSTNSKIIRRIITPLVVSALLVGLTLLVNDEQNNQSYIASGGLVPRVTSIMITNAIVPIIMEFPS
ncbi:hypothetical protein IMG5_155870 [Ichthyophthirius multifiliis]|uniref:Uncharacterized protein n=1 Tax=Ichthyophthirius multifiliis TaxID=5932 RepID=G0QZD4_ICHMU|nr:hypothetical protein IMG5_155870 [Ichthyophthirius multifiliis]EGR29437.1 hypothetical protein IMG5_155870 [Ichthyophthirius multifiliis]|eukprot:XP_004030673.1 hypothetical protein IMG5_155870 [Ichthyophthirius multifiliis]